jgi:hypothetical protein
MSKQFQYQVGDIVEICANSPFSAVGRVYYENGTLGTVKQIILSTEIWCLNILQILMKSCKCFRPIGGKRHICLSVYTDCVKIHSSSPRFATNSRFNRLELP